VRFEGSIKAWNADRGFGFIEPAQGGQEIFVHVTAFQARITRPQVGQRVSFELELNREGKKRAKQVQLLRERKAPVQSESLAQWGGASLLAVPLFVVAYLLTAVFWRVPGWVGALYAAASIACAIAYAQDKAAARSGGRRTSEETLLALGLFGGWPGAILAQQFLRHKSSKASFRSAFWLTVIANVAGFFVLASPWGRQALR
jgi:uncharacterized membrane protein YsdA (DUF1294 family)/cold shock CspA family protein